MEQKTKKIIEKLTKNLFFLEEPIHLLAICTGGITLAKMMRSFLKEKGIRAEYYEIWTDIINKKAEITKTNFSKSRYKGTAVIIEDVIWHGTHLPPIKKMLKKMNPRKKFYIVALLDCNKKADFSVFN